MNIVFVAGYDQFHRPLIVFDNTVQNTKDVDMQLVALAWNLDTACRMMDPAKTDKYVVFMNLETFSMFNCPPMKVWSLRKIGKSLLFASDCRLQRRRYLCFALAFLSG